MNNPLAHVVLRVRHADMASFFHPSERPTILFKQLDDCFTVHSGYYNYLVRFVNTIPTEWVANY
jgi:hypothetical protein